MPTSSRSSWSLDLPSTFFMMSASYPLGAHERQAHHPTLHALPKKMEFCINMLRAIVYGIGF
jgi:hypothetical protein